MRTTHALSAMLLVADGEAQASELPHKILLNGNVLTCFEASVAAPGRPICSVYPDGRVETFHAVLPLEVSNVQ